MLTPVALAEDRDPCARAARCDAWDAAMAGLSPTQRRVVTLHYGESLSFAEIGQRVGLSKSLAHQLCQDALALLKSSGGYRALAPA